MILINENENKIEFSYSRSNLLLQTKIENSKSKILKILSLKFLKF
jgi:hypothetical protein